MPPTRLLRAGDADSILIAAETLRNGGLVAFPTETVYGLGALGLDPIATERIFVAKRRPHSDPLILHVADPDWLVELARAVPPVAEVLMAAFWPGPLTLVLEKTDRVPDLVTAGGNSVAVRMPAHPVALALIRIVGQPVAAPSANLFTRPSATTAQHVLEDLDGRIDAVLDGGPTTIGVESTVVDVRGPVPKILRPGGISREDLERVLEQKLAVPQHRIKSNPGEEQETPFASPGLLSKHYSPRAQVLLYDGPRTAVLAALEALTREHPEMAILAYSEDVPELSSAGAIVVDLGNGNRSAEAAQRLYAALRQLDAQGVELIAAYLAPSGGLGEAVNDRLRRAASGRLISC